MTAVQWPRFARPLVASLLVASLATSFAVVPPLAFPASAATPAAITGLHVVGNQIANGAGAPVQILGVNRSGTEYACIQGFGFFDGPSDAASVAAIAGWHTNAVRLGLNEDCWLNINGVNPAYGGANYQNAIVNYVNTLNNAGLIAILELHWSAPGSVKALGQQPMPDRDHSVAFWQGVATTFRSNSSVLFDIFNEPYPDSNQDTTAAWTCWRDGGTCPGVAYTAAGTQELVTAIRGAGATNVIMVGGVQYTNTLSRWLTYRPNDGLNNIAASWHVYKGQVCSTVSCFDASIAPVASAVPLVAGEIGQGDCQHDFIDTVMNWMDAHKLGYLAWTWDTWGCTNGGLALINDYAGTPSQPYGQAYHDHLAALNSAPTATPTRTPTRTATATPTRTATPLPPTATATPIAGTGVNAYATIQAESFTSKATRPQTEPTTDIGGGLDIGYIRSTDWLGYTNVNFGSTAATQFVARVASAAAAGVTGKVEVHLDSATSPAVGSFTIGNTGGYQSWVTKTASISPTTGTHTVYLVFTSASTGHFVNINWFDFAH